MIQGHLLIKHSMSRASDAKVAYELDPDGRTITLRMEFVASTLLQGFLSYTLPSRYGIEPWYDDHPVRQQGRALWRILLIVGERRYWVRLFKQLSLVPQQDQWALELHEVKG